MTLPDNFLKWILERNHTICHRQLLVVTGEQTWIKETLENIQPFLNANTLYVGKESDYISCENSSYRSKLGQEFDFIIYDAFCGIRASALFALSGTVKSGGLMILLAPKLEIWPHFPDPERIKRTSYGYESNVCDSQFLVWLIDRIKSDNEVSILSESGFSGKVSQAVNTSFPDETKGITTIDQTQTIEKISSIFTQKVKFNLVLTADRGRGKSATLGLLASQLARQKNIKIAVTAPHKAMTQNVFKHATGKTDICYQPFDELLLSDKSYDLILVDEAAAIPTATLTALVSKFDKLVFSTTNHGYEGSGKGFELRFTPYLHQLQRYFEQFVLETPVRWFPLDALEQFWFKSMLMLPLDKIIDEKPTYPSSGPYEIRPESLVANPTALYQIFQLLVNAHYQTTPDDLVRLLDAEDQSVHISTSENGEITGVALVSLEGGEKLSDLAEKIAQGQRRVNGHLIPQRLAFLRGSKKLAKYKYARIVRIAVKEEYRRQNIASELINHIGEWSSDRHINYLGASFGARPDLVKFWQKNGFIPVHLGLKKDASSGEHSLIVARSLVCDPSTDIILNDELKYLVALFRQEFTFQVNYRLAHLSTELMGTLKSYVNTSPKKQRYDELDQQMIDEFTTGLRPLFTCEYHIEKLLRRYTEACISSCRKEAELITDLLHQKLAYENICELHKLTGKKQIEEYARTSCKCLLAEIKKAH